MGFIYLVQPCELVGTNRFKIGCSDKVGLDRLLSYKNGTRYLCLFDVDHPFDAENELKLKYAKFNNIAGKEYFEGDENNIINCFIEFILDYHNTNKKSVVEEQAGDLIYHEVQCQFKKYCEQCCRGTLSTNQSIIDHYCMERCSTCEALRNTQKKFHTQKLCKQLLSDLSHENKLSESVLNKSSKRFDNNKEKNIPINAKTLNLVVNHNNVIAPNRFERSPSVRSLVHEYRTSLVYQKCEVIK